eukprot:scaffold3081_cov114-Isochrysis_galbana.AAC.3
MPRLPSAQCIRPERAQYGRRPGVDTGPPMRFDSSLCSPLNPYQSPSPPLTPALVAASRVAIKLKMLNKHVRIIRIRSD